MQHSSGRNATSRRAVIVLELIVALPIFIIALLAVVQFGTYFVRMQQVALACRVGAEEASQTMGLPLSGEVPLNIRNAVDKQLLSSNIQRCRIRLEHNVTMGGTPVELVSPNMGACPCGPTTALAPPPPRSYVRLTICVPWTELMPNCLSKFGFDISTRIAECTTVFRYEL